MDETTKDELLQFATLHDIYKVDPEELAKYAPPQGKRDFWIVSHWPHVEYGANNHAKAQAQALRDKFPEKEFRVYHCKRNMHRSQSRQTMVALCDVIDSLLSPHDHGAPIQHRMQKARKLVNHVRGVKQKTVIPTADKAGV